MGFLLIMPRRIIVIYFASLLLIIAISIVWYVATNHRYKAVSYNIDRLVATGVAREKIYWECLDEHNKQRQNEWMQSEEYKKEQAIYNSCKIEAEQKCSNRIKQSGIDWECIMPGYLCNGPEMKWQEWNDWSSPECSKIADESETGKVMTEFRKKVPIESLTSDELVDKIKSLYRK